MKNVILAVIILILVGGIAYWQMNKPVEEEIVDNTNQSEENNWLTYRNEDYGYLIKYPAKISLVTDRVLERGTQGNPGFELDQGGHFAIGIYNNENKDAAEEWLDYKYREYSDGWPGVYSNDLINDINSVKATLDNRQPGDPYNCYIEWFIFTKGNSFYTIAGEFCNVDQSSIDLFQNIVSTFEFID